MDRSTIPAVPDSLLTSSGQAVTTTSPALQHPAENLLKETRVMNSITERKSAGVKFLEEHEELQGRHDTALLTLSTQAKMLDKQDAEIRLLEDRVKNAEASEAVWLHHSVELATQVRMLVEGSKRALLIADQVANALSAKMAASKPDTSAASAAAVEDALHQFAARNTSEPLDLPPAKEWMTTATRLMMGEPPQLSQ